MDRTYQIPAGVNLWTGRVARVGPCEWSCDIAALPEWDALRGALASGRASTVELSPSDEPATDDDPGETPTPVRRRRRRKV